MPTEPVDLSEYDKSLSDSVTKVFIVKEIRPFLKTAFRMEFGFTARPLRTPPGADGILMLIIHIK